MSDGGTLHTDLTGGVLTLSLDHPPANTLSLELIAQLNKAFTQAEKERSVRCVVLTGSGDHFCVGQDIHDFLNEDVPFRYHMLRSYNP